MAKILWVKNPGEKLRSTFFFFTPFFVQPLDRILGFWKIERDILVRRNFLMRQKPFRKKPKKVDFSKKKKKRGTLRSSRQKKREYIWKKNQPFLKIFSTTWEIWKEIFFEKITSFLIEKKKIPIRHIPHNFDGFRTRIFLDSETSI